MFSSGYYFDDILNSQSKYYLLFKGMKSRELSLKLVNGWLASGRIIPGALYGVLPNLYHSLLRYKGIIFAFHFANILLFSVFLYSLFKNYFLSFLFALSILVFFQFKEYPDSLTSFGILMPLLVFKFITALIFFKLYLVRKKIIYLFISAILYLLMLLMFYEIAYLLFPIVLLIAYMQNKNYHFVFKKSFIYILLSFIFIVLYFIVSIRSSHNYVGSTINFDLSLIISTLIKQTLSSFPVTYLMVRKFFSFIYLNKLDYLLSLAYSLMFYIFLLNLKIRDTKFLFIFGALLCFIPALPLSMSLRYQQEINWGRTHIPVYAQYFGACILSIAAIVSILNCISKLYIKKIFTFFLAIIFSAIYFITIQNNKVTIEEMNTTFKYPRELVESALKNGLLFELQPEDIIITLNNNAWDNSHNYFAFSNKKFTVINLKQYLENDNNAKRWDQLTIVNNMKNESVPTF